MRLHGVPDHEIASHLRMSPPVFKAVSSQMLAKFAAHRGDKPGGGLNVGGQSTGVARRDLYGKGMSNQVLSPGQAILAELRDRRG